MAQSRRPRRAGAAAAPSEQISVKWIGNAKRECRRCGVKITNLAKQVGEVRNRYPGPVTDLLCMTCHTTRSQWLGSKTPPLYVDSDWIMPASSAKPAP